MKTWVISFVTLVLITILSSGSCNDLNEDTPERLWWNSLNKTWKTIFLRELDMLGEKPSQADLQKMWRLEDIECDHFPLGEAGLEPLVRLKRLKSISAGSTHITNIDALSKLDSLEFVNFADTPIENIEALRNHQNLESVYIQQTRVKNLKTLEGKEKLQVVVFDQSPVGSIFPIMNLLKLSIVSFRETNVTDAETTRFISLHPGCDVLHDGLK